jgi:transposase
MPGLRLGWTQALIRAGRRAFLMSNFRTIDRETGFLLPPSVDEWLPEKHLARFVVEVVEGLDLRAMSGSYRGSGSASYHPRMLLGLLVYGYATGVFSSRKLERATYDSVAFRFIAANDHPDHDTIATSRRRFGAFSRRSKLCSFKCCCWRGRWAF